MKLFSTWSAKLPSSSNPSRLRRRPKKPESRQGPLAAAQLVVAAIRARYNHVANSLETRGPLKAPLVDLLPELVIIPDRDGDHEALTARLPGTRVKRCAHHHCEAPGGICRRANRIELLHVFDLYNCLLLTLEGP